jgi:hypothetical protein
VCVEIKKHFLSASECFHGLKRLLKLYLCQRKTKPLLYKVLIRPAVTYASETWVIAKKGKEALVHLREGFLEASLGQYKRLGNREEYITLNYISYVIK